MIALGFVLVLVGFLFSFLMVLRIIEPSYVLSFLAYAVSFFGLFMGLIGVALYRRSGGRRG
jgi:Co/Zn/Cd efflux system component